MLVVVIVMVLILLLAGAVTIYVAYPHRGERLPLAPWLGTAMSKAVDAAPLIAAGPRDSTTSIAAPEHHDEPAERPNTGTPKNGVPKSAAPKSGAPKNGTPKSGAPKNGTPRSGAPENGTSAEQHKDADRLT